MKPLPLLLIGGLAAFLVMYWSMPYHAPELQDDRIPSSMPNSTPGGATRLSTGAQVDRQASGDGARDVQALVDRILGRPLFNADRRPAAGTPAAGPASLPRLTAVLVSSRSKAVIFAGGADGKPVVLAEGGRIGNYVVRSIGAGQVTLSGPNGTQVIRPTADSGSPIAAAVITERPSIADLLRQSAPSGGLVGLPATAQR